MRCIGSLAKKGFTLIELLVVIAIIALLMAIISPSLRKAKEAARLMICASNQRQCVLGVQSYMVDNDDSTPPHIASRHGGSESQWWYSWPNHINYHSQEPVTSFNYGGAIHYYLGSYLPVAGSFMCPLGPARSDDLQGEYDDYAAKGYSTLTSYNIFWGGYEFAGGVVGVGGRKFKGPWRTSTRSTATLMLCDVASWRTSGKEWWLAHRSRLDAIQEKKDSIYGINISILWFWDSPPDIEPVGLKLNAAYLDGSVDRYKIEDAVYGMGRNGSKFYFSRRWK